MQTMNQLLQLCTARTAWSDSVIRSETSLITESDWSGPIRQLSWFRSFSVNVLPCWPIETRLPRSDQWKAEKLGVF